MLRIHTSPVSTLDTNFARRTDMRLDACKKDALCPHLSAVKIQ